MANHSIKVLEHNLITELERRLMQGGGDISMDEDAVLHNTIPVSKPVQALQHHNATLDNCQRCILF